MKLQTILVLLSVAGIIGFAIQCFIGAQKEIRWYGKPSFLKGFIEGPYVYFAALTILVYMILLIGQFISISPRYHGWIAFDFLPLLILSFHITRKLLMIFPKKKLRLN